VLKLSPLSQSILIVDDELDIVAIFRHALHKQGYRVFGFTDPLLALEHFKLNAEEYHLLIVDIRMPSMNGFELATRIKSIKPETKIIFMSAFEMRDFEIGRSSLIIRDFIRKPVDIDTLLQKVKNVMTS